MNILKIESTVKKNKIDKLFLILYYIFEMPINIRGGPDDLE